MNMADPATPRHLGPAMICLAALVPALGACHGARPEAVFEAPKKTFVVAHRGGALEAPENTVAAVRHAVAIGAQWIEVDVHLTRDGVPVVLHDETLDRTTDGVGPVSALTLDELRRVRVDTASLADEARRRAPTIAPAFADLGTLPVPTLDEVLDVPGAHLMIEIKSGPDREPLTREVVRRIREHRARHRAAVASFDPAVLDIAADLDASVPLIGIADSPAIVTAHLQRPLSVLAVRVDLVPQALAAAPRGVAVWAWTITSVEQALVLADQGVDGVITDVPAAVIEALGGRTPVARRMRSPDLREARFDLGTLGARDQVRQ